MHVSIRLLEAPLDAATWLPLTAPPRSCRIPILNAPMASRSTCGPWALSCLFSSQACTLSPRWTHPRCSQPLCPEGSTFPRLSALPLRACFPVCCHWIPSTVHRRPKSCMTHGSVAPLLLRSERKRPTPRTMVLTIRLFPTKPPRLLTAHLRPQSQPQPRPQPHACPLTALRSDPPHTTPPIASEPASAVALATDGWRPCVCFANICYLYILLVIVCFNILVFGGFSFFFCWGNFQ